MNAADNKILYLSPINSTRKRENREASRLSFSTSLCPAPLSTSKRQSRNVAMAGEQFDRLAELINFDETKMGVKGLVDAGITAVPRIFLHQPENTIDQASNETVVPTIDMAGVHSSPRRKEVVEEISRACREVGFFQIVNHGIPLEFTERLIGSVKAFHDLPGEEKTQFYARKGTGKGVSYISNIDLFNSKAASWRDTLQVLMGNNWPNLENIPEICRNEVVEWNEHCTRVAELLMEFLCEGLGLESQRLDDLACSKRKTFVGHYYPWCPQPHLTLGLSAHTDPGVLTILLQDHIGGLQVKCGEKWVEVKPIPGALVINIGDILQMMSNDEYVSGVHRVVAHQAKEPRVSVAVFFNPMESESLFGPFPELSYPAKPPVYRQFTLTEYLEVFFNRELDDKSLKDHFKLLTE